MSLIRRLLMLGFLNVIFILTTCVQFKKADIDWPQITKESRPWTYWWWMGSAVDKENLTWQLEKLHRVGIGGVHIVPIYGVKGYEAQYIPYLSRRWMEMLSHTVSEAQRLGMGVDMTCGTGWPFGGPQVDSGHAAAKLLFETWTVKGGESLGQKIACRDGVGAPLQALMAFSDSAKAIDLTENVGGDSLLKWTAPEGSWQLFGVFRGWTHQNVKRAAPGARGRVMDYFSRASLDNYLARFDTAFANYSGQMV